MYKKKRKSTRMRAKTTHGYGSMKKNRGRGNKGGQGRAGTGKRADTKKPNVWSLARYGRKKGFKSKNKMKIVTINISQLDVMIKYFIAKKAAEEKNGVYYLDLSKTKYNKLLGSGNVNNKYNLIVKYSTQRAVDKIKTAGGSIKVLSSEKSEQASQAEVPAASEKSESAKKSEAETEE